MIYRERSPLSVSKRVHAHVCRRNGKILREALVILKEDVEYAANVMHGGNRKIKMAAYDQVAQQIERVKQIEDMSGDFLKDFSSTSEKEKEAGPLLPPLPPLPKK